MTSALFFWYLDQEQCEEGAARLTGGPIAQEGRLEVCINGVWGSVCSTGWDNTDAFVTCKQLGYGNAGNFFVHINMYYYTYTAFSLITQNQLATQILSLVRVRDLLSSRIWAVMDGRKILSSATGQNTAHSLAPEIN